MLIFPNFGQKLSVGYLIMIFDAFRCCNSSIQNVFVQNRKSRIKRDCFLSSKEFASSYLTMKKFLQQKRFYVALFFSLKNKMQDAYRSSFGLKHRHYLSQSNLNIVNIEITEIDPLAPQLLQRYDKLVQDSIENSQLAHIYG